MAGTKDAVLMVESETSGLTEKEMLAAVKFGHENFVPIIEAIEKLAKKAGKPKWEVEIKDHSTVKTKIKKLSKLIYEKLFKKLIRKRDQLQFQK